MRGNKTQTNELRDDDDNLHQGLLLQRIESLAALTAQLEDRAADVKGELQRLDGGQHALSQASEDLSRRLGALGDKNAQLEQAVHEATELSREAENRMAGISGEFLTTDAGTTEIRKQLGQLKSQGTQRGQRLNALGKRVKSIESSLMQAAERNDSLARRLDAVDSEQAALAGLEQSLQTVRSELTDAMQRLVGLETASAQDTALVAMDEKLNSLEALIAKRQDGSADTLAELEQGLAQVSRDQASLEQQMANVANETQGMASALDTLREESLALLRQIPDMEPILARIGILEQATEPLNKGQELHQNAIQSLQQRVDGLDGQSHEAAQSLAEEMRKVASLEQELSRFDQRLNDDQAGVETRLNTTLQSIDQRLAEVEQARERMGEGFDNTLVSVNELKNRTEGLTAQLRALETAHSQVAGLGAANDSLLQAQQAQQDELLTLRKRLESLAAAVHETMDLIGEEANKLAAIGEQVDAEAAQRQDLAQRHTHNQDEMRTLADNVSELGAEQTRQAEDTRQTLSGLQTRFDKLEQSLLLFDDTGKTLGARIEAAAGDLSGLQLRTSELLDRLHGLESSSAPVAGQLEQQQQSLTSLAQRLDEFKQARDTLSERLAEESGRLAAESSRGAESAQKITAATADIEGLKEQLGALRQEQQQQWQKLGSQLGEIGTGQESMAEENRHLIQQLRDKLQQLDDNQGELHAAGQALGERFGSSEAEVQGLHGTAEALNQRFQGLADLPTRVSALESQAAPLGDTLAAQGEALTDVKGLLDELRQATGELNQRITAEVDNMDRRHSDSELASQAKMTALAEDIASCRAALSLAESKIGDLGTSGDRLRSELQQTAQRIADLAKRDQQRLRMIEASQDNLNDVNTLMDANASVLAQLQQSEREQNDKIAATQGGQRLLGWGGVIAAALLITLSLAGYWLSDSKQQTIRQFLMEQLAGLEKRLSSSALGNPEQLRILAQDMDDLRLHVRTLDSRFDDLPVAEPEAMAELPALDEYGMQQNNIMQALDELNARLVAIEEMPAAPPSSSPSPARARALDVAPPDAWSQAQSRAYYTLQIVGVRDQASLTRFVRKYRLQEDSAYLQTIFRDEPWFVLFHGTYRTRAQAVAAAEKLSPRLNGGKPWVRRLPKRGQISPFG
jgi:chromosome segregation ATPase